MRERREPCVRVEAPSRVVSEQHSRSRRARDRSPAERPENTHACHDRRSGVRPAPGRYRRDDRARRRRRSHARRRQPRRRPGAALAGRPVGRRGTGDRHADEHRSARRARQPEPHEPRGDARGDRHGDPRRELREPDEHVLLLRAGLGHGRREQQSPRRGAERGRRSHRRVQAPARELRRHGSRRVDRRRRLLGREREAGLDRHPARRLREPAAADQHAGGELRGRRTGLQGSRDGRADRRGAGARTLASLGLGMLGLARFGRRAPARG
jgi:hypothetical protein